ncbi:16S rRNA (guanine(966)-N(2))-methyltransferase RsmD [Mesomycoplasma hyorhinis]|uniref:16S rRNA (guanine(966)-N(2))-methyltransferase RsmD n=1 Tax=Mesomycoplasma hyorhinis TaxID=2100 RepID=UPI001371C984|nr:16S rRNA (guanine(966)-N(2))-methyltransferase RsmD [Mesomycoplasma hyorhinis]MXR09526.1 16S rRNA (guanine(966)-N(2))-methyltransferase RsmD [Mesomycoplasma hyorhinis]MXR11577.1 16S rRNA (guanine(966)-N(2))-methyltransferase RsmD [Mesomycoplasma hyorhinis]MXR58070.1 16S rRNA (guanine(966)-N(2))-methyltransferase RsmD [Mesomycoplasma hyorhinis]
MIRIIAGKYRGLLIKNPDFNIVRPMSDRTREAIFSSLQFFISDKRVLDLFSGTGAIGIEALSRGAKEVIASELDKKVFDNIVELKNKHSIENYFIQRKSALVLLDEVQNQKFSIIFLDPPHAQIEVTKASFAKIYDYQILEKEGFLIYKTNLGAQLIPDNFKILKEKKYAKNTVYFLQYKDEG